MFRKAILLLLNTVSSLPLVFGFLTDKEIGKHYGIGVVKKAALVFRFRQNRRKVRTESHWQEHLELAANILRIPPSLKGDVIECGCYKGGSSVNLSLVCAAVGRKLIICDSFEGLPDPGQRDEVHYNLYSNHYDHYEKGRFAASLQEVKTNLAEHGCVDVCEFVVGYFENSLGKLKGQKQYVMAFFDADLVLSLRSCLLGIWPNLQDGCRMYVHEARSLSLVSVFFDRGWWLNNLFTAPPGFVGAGTGLPLQGGVGSELGFAQKGNKLMGDELDEPSRAGATAGPPAADSSRSASAGSC